MSIDVASVFSVSRIFWRNDKREIVELNKNISNLIFVCLFPISLSLCLSNTKLSYLLPFPAVK